MIKIVLMIMCAMLIGCEIHTGTGSAYGLTPKEWVKRQPKYFGEEEPALSLGEHLLVQFAYTPGRLLEPYEVKCEDNMTNSIMMISYSDTEYLIDLSKIVIRSGGRVHYVKNYKTYKNEEITKVSKGTLRKVAILEKNFKYIRDNVNKSRVETNKIIPNLIEQETILLFDGKFSCGENNYEMDIWFIEKATGKSEKYTVYFFPWTHSIALK